MVRVISFFFFFFFFGQISVQLELTNRQQVVTDLKTKKVCQVDKQRRRTELRTL